MDDWEKRESNYKHTAIVWFQNFDKNWNTQESKHDERFYRMWKRPSAAAPSFRSPNNGVRHPPLTPIPFSKRGPVVSRKMKLGALPRCQVSLNKIDPAKFKLRR